jgi:XTP/dITP diphosphohydrolase/tetrapyrrole methylase family protein/MazG family protein/ATP diphosphatase
LSDGLPGALERLDEITRRLRRECPWDREQDARSIVPHTVEEAYELADAAHSGDDAKMLDELGDVLFQVVFLSLLLEERDAGDLAQVADQCRRKLIRRHPHVFGCGARGNNVPAALLPEEELLTPGEAVLLPQEEPVTSEEVLRNWDQIKAETEGGGLFGDLPETLPATLYAKKAQRRAARAEGQDVQTPGVAESAAALDAAKGRDERFGAAGELLFAAVTEAAGAGVDPELALRAAADRYIARIREGQEST